MRTRIVDRFFFRAHRVAGRCKLIDRAHQRHFIARHTEQNRCWRGMAVVLEEARSFGELLKQGWRPWRTMIFRAWDGEEPGLLGSTEWVGQHADELRQKAAVYINTDSTGKGFFSASGSHTLEQFVNEAATKKLSDR